MATTLEVCRTLYRDRKPARRMKPEKRFALLKVSRKMATTKRPSKARYWWSTFEVRVPEWILAQAGIEPEERVMVSVVEPGMLVVTRVS